MQGPDFDFATSPLLTATPQRARAARRAAEVRHGLRARSGQRPARSSGSTAFGEGSALGGQWGAAVDDRVVYVGVGGSLSAAPGGMHAIDLDTGQRVWYSPPQPKLCARRRRRALLRGTGRGRHGHSRRRLLRRLRRRLARLRRRRRVDRVAGGHESRVRDRQRRESQRRHASTAPVPSSSNGILLVNSGYNGIVGRAGNVLLAFEAR